MFNIKPYIVYNFLTILLFCCSCREDVNAAHHPLFWGVALEGNPITTKMVKAADNETGLPSQIVLFFLQWPMSPETDNFPADSLNAIWKRGAVPCITWEPMFYKDGEEIMIPGEQILNGGYDNYLKTFAKGIKSWGKPVIIRFAHEMNLERYHWGTGRDDYNSKSPQIYKKMFQYVISSLKKEGADNVIRAFCPNAESVPNTSYKADAAWNRINSYYPGDEYVDILGIDGYNWGTSRTIEKDGWKSNWKSFDDIISPIYKELKKISSKKPVFIFETATVENGGDKNEWIRNAFSSVQNLDIQGIIWFQAKKEEDWRINSSGTAGYIDTILPEISASQKWIKDLNRKSK